MEEKVGAALSARFAVSSKSEMVNAPGVVPRTEELSNGESDMSDSWCDPYWDGAKWVYGGAARNKRISNGGGMDTITETIGKNAARMAFEEADRKQREGKIVPLRPRKKAA
jgi:hypothetical protein